jgi:small basic protein
MFHVRTAKKKKCKFLTTCDVQDALYTGSLKFLPEYEASGGDMQTYIHSVTSVYNTAQASVGAAEAKRSHFGAFRRIMGEMFDMSLLKSPTFIIVCISGFIVYLGESMAACVYVISIVGGQRQDNATSSIRSWIS